MIHVTTMRFSQERDSSTVRPLRLKFIMMSDAQDVGVDVLHQGAGRGPEVSASAAGRCKRRGREEEGTANCGKASRPEPRDMEFELHLIPPSDTRPRVGPNGEGQPAAAGSSPGLRREYRSQASSLCARAPETAGLSSL